MLYGFWASKALDNRVLGPQDLIQEVLGCVDLRGFAAFIFGIVIMVLGRYLRFGYLDPDGPSPWTSTSPKTT